jgi:hypothetical protein
LDNSNKKLQGAYYFQTGTYTVTFTVKDIEDNTPITDAKITLNGIANADGNYTFTNVTGPRSHVYIIVKNGYVITTGRLEVKGNTNPEISIASLTHQGAGTEGNPYTIANEDELLILSEFVGPLNKDNHFLLTADIDLGGSNWTPIVGSFMGKLHGDNHKIKNINITVTTGAGLFSELGPEALVENVHIEGGTIKGAAAGSIAAMVSAPSSGTVIIRNCTNSATIIGTGGSGGIVGDLSIGGGSLTIASCFNMGNVTTTAGGAGGIIGGHSGIGSGTLLINDCYNNAVITSTNASSFAAGIAGYLYQASAPGTTTIQNCHSEGSVAGSTTAGGIVGRVPNSTSTIIRNNVALQTNIKGNASYAHPILGYYAGVTASNNYYSSTMTGESATISDEAIQRGISVSVETAKTAAFYTTNLSAWSFTNIWAIRERAGFPYFKYQSAPALITDLKPTSATLNTLASSGIISVYKGYEKDFLESFDVAAAGDTTFLLSDVADGDTLFFISNEQGKAQSYPVQGVVGTFSGIDEIGNPAAIKIYPNPVSDLLNISAGESSGPVRIDIFSIAGKRYFTQTCTTSAITLDLSKYPSGLLLIKVSTNDSFVVKTIIKK